MKTEEHNTPAPGKWRALAAVVPAVALSVVIAGCAGSDPATSASSSASATPVGESFRIGLEAPLTGSQSELGKGMLQGAQLAAQTLNSNGGILGKQVSVVPIDDAADPATGQTAANAAVGNIDAIVGPYNSGVGLVTLPIYTNAGLVPMRLTSADNTAGLGFTLQPMTSQIAPTAGTAISQWLGATTVAILYDPTADYTNLAAEALRTDLQSRGVTVTSFTPINPGQSSYAPELATASSGNPQVTYIAAYYPEAAVVAKDLAASGSASKCVADYAAFDNGFITDAGTDVARTCDVLGVPAPSDFTGSAELVNQYRTTFGAPPNVWSPYTYDSVLLLADAISRAGSSDATALSNALAATNSWSGWTGSVSFETPSGNRVPSQVAVLQVNADGQFSVSKDWAQSTNFVY